jgi:hypothetical protein
MEAGNISFEMMAWPLSVRLPVSYEATDPPALSEEDEEGNIFPTAALDDHSEHEVEDDLDENFEEDER